MNTRMNITPISDLTPGRLDYVLCVRISRMWEFRGDNEQNDIKHLDLVLIDHEGDSIYAEVPPDVIPHLRPHLGETKIVYMSKITVYRAKPGYRPVANPYMIKLNERTEITKAINPELDFPKYTFSLVPFSELQNYVKKTERFLDVIGKITGVSDVATVYTYSGDSMPRRIIHLQDLKGNTIELSLSGKRASEFDGDKVLQIGQKHHIIAIFVGTLMKLYKDAYTFLGGSSACRWYINGNDIPEIKDFQKSLPAEAIPVQKLLLQVTDDTQQNSEKRTLLQLKNIDPFIEKGKIFECTATIVGITENQTWCYRACKVCNSKMNRNANNFECSKHNCPCTQFDWKYKIPFIASDTTCNLEFMFFEKKGTELVGKSAEALHKQYNPNETPTEISHLIGHKFTFIVRVLPNKSIWSDNPSFEVIRIKERFGKQPTNPRPKATSIGSISLSHLSEENLPPLIPITSVDTDQSSSPKQQFEENEDMEIELSGIWDESNKRKLQETDEENLEINDEGDDDNQLKKGKKQRSQARASKH